MRRLLHSGRVPSLLPGPLMNAKTAFGDDQARNAALPHPDYACTCPVLDHDHKWGSQCSRKATWAGGICPECRYWGDWGARP